MLDNSSDSEITLHNREKRWAIIRNITYAQLDCALRNMTLPGKACTCIIPIATLISR